MNKVVLMKTYIWSIDLEKFSHKIFTECSSVGIDFYIIMHDDHGNLIEDVKSDIIKKLILVVTKIQIKNLYSSGFLSMHLSNHWLLMWFYSKFFNKYDYFWTIEYDVRINGDSSIIWNNQEKHDFIYVRGNYLNNDHKHNNTYFGKKLSSHEKYHGFLQISRYSKKFLDYLHQCFLDGENGQDEMIIFSLCHRGRFTLTNKPLKSLIGGKWTWKGEFSLYNSQLYEYYESNFPNKLIIFHPIKS